MLGMEDPVKPCMHDESTFDKGKHQCFMGKIAVVGSYILNQLQVYLLLKNKKRHDFFAVLNVVGTCLFMMEMVEGRTCKMV